MLYENKIFAGQNSVSEEDIQSFAPEDGNLGPGANGEVAAEHLFACGCAACLAANESATEGNSDGSQTAGEVSDQVAATLEEMADYLAFGYWKNGTGRYHNLGSEGLDPNNGVLHYNISGFSKLSIKADIGFSDGVKDSSGMSKARSELIRDAFDVYEAVLGIDFVETDISDESVVDIFFTDKEPNAFTNWAFLEDGTIDYAYINIHPFVGDLRSEYDSLTLETILHEIGHALGLGHMGWYNWYAGFQSDAVFELDSTQASMMSYFKPSRNPNTDASDVFLQTPMVVDWLALEMLYDQFDIGAEQAFLGDTVYGFNTTISPEESDIWSAYQIYAGSTASTIVDSGGIDTLDFRGYDENQTIDLTVQLASQKTQNASDIGGTVGNLTLSIGTVIENAIAGRGNDRLIGNGADNTLKGRSGDDWITGRGGTDDLRGGGGRDELFGGSGNDYIEGGSRRDILMGGSGQDELIGGSGEDVLVGGQGDDVLRGGTGDDLLFGRADDDVLLGLEGRDELLGGAGNDYLEGGSKRDTLKGGLGQDELIGGSGDDILSGGCGDDVLFGETGNDLLFGRADNDFLSGGEGRDTLRGNLGTDRLSGGGGDDKLKGGLGLDYLNGGAGDDKFVFNSVSESPMGAGDIIADFEVGDRIKVSGIDADTTSAATNDAFDWMADAAFTNTAGELRYKVSGSDTLVQGDVDGDGAVDIEITLIGVSALNFADFIF